jgi:hypothetical protein
LVVFVSAEDRSAHFFRRKTNDEGSGGDGNLRESEMEMERVL